ncbi:MAG: response regulator, partial [Comamonadaceae bacterium]
IAMPRLTGHRAAQIIRASVPHTSLIALSGFATKADVDEALLHGFHAHLPKPLDFGLLTNLLQERQPAPGPAS